LPTRKEKSNASQKKNHTHGLHQTRKSKSIKRRSQGDSQRGLSHLLVIVFPSLLRVEKTFCVTDLFALRDFAAAHAGPMCLDIHGRQSSRWAGLGPRFDVNRVQAMRGVEPGPAVSHDG
jgi:hypothetical protein